ncbi:hypothetical protein [Qipengyuania flava]|uniref:hypothetical protein n=1 Tax=Qipengyuania flava TaxID=192812 RepID=UPI001C628745|nr:hypothetical protein [Qipengyuania flava]QYJ06557.1 hypothetical protein KUV82_10840 [Qipengyuania flava]
MIRPLLAALAAALAVAPPLAAQSAADNGPAEAFETIASWQGRWQVAETTALTIVFEVTARGSTIVERWETAAGLYSMNVYHRDGDAVIATHYCPQGNQPRLEAHRVEDGTIRFAFRDVTDLDAGESHTHALGFTAQPGGTLVRTEVYTGPEGMGDPSSYTLKRTD